MVYRNAVLSFLEDTLKMASFKDSSLNGLQIEGSDNVTKFAVSVDASKDLAIAAKKIGANFVVVHHGLFWGEPLPIVGPLKEIVSICFEAGINLFAAHLPLDADCAFGNNFCLARNLCLTDLKSAYEYCGSLIGCIGENLTQKPLDFFIDYIKNLPINQLSTATNVSQEVTYCEIVKKSTSPAFEQQKKELLVLNFGPNIPKRVGVVSGGGADAIKAYDLYKVDTLITGEPKQFAYHYAKERNLNVIFGGHYATETIGVIEVGKALNAKFKLPWEFIDLPTGI